MDDDAPPNAGAVRRRAILAGRDGARAVDGDAERVHRSVAPFAFLKGYDWRRMLPYDATAGITVGCMLVPQGMAYALLAGLPPVVGLYASGVPVIAYAALGASGQLSVGPTAVISMLVLGVLNDSNPTGDVAEAKAIALLLAFLSGAIMILLGLLRMGGVSNFVSHSVLPVTSPLFCIFYLPA